MPTVKIILTDLLYQVDFDPTQAPGVYAPGNPLLVRTDVPGTYWKFGNNNTDWLPVGNNGGGNTGNSQRFTYTVTGVEPDLSELTITLPAARANANYLVFVSQGNCTFLLDMSTGTRTINNFVLSLSALATAGDVFNFLVIDPT